MNKFSRINLGWILWLGFALLLAACGTQNITNDELVATAVASGNLQYVELTPGTGSAATTGSLVSVHYVGTLQDGTEFDNSYTRGQPLQFVMGRGQVIAGWEKGISQMREGGKARLIIPPALAYGESGAGGVIPPNATLIFEVELVKVEPTPPTPPAAATAVNEADYTTTSSGLQYYDFVVGDGETAVAGKLVTVHYTGWLLDGTRFDSSLDRGVPFQFPLGAGGVIPGWDEGLTGMRVGGKRQLRIPPELGYGEQGISGVVPGNAVLLFEVELLAVQ